MKNNEHTFVICAYKESPYLQDCIKSLKQQDVGSNIICATSTPCKYIEDICEKHNIVLYVNPKQEGIAADWNFAISKVKTSYITIAHQDDIYEPEYLKIVLSKLEISKKPLIVFTGYYEIREDKKVYSNRLMRVKHLLSTPFRIKSINKSRFFARRIFMFGNPICCPSVTFTQNALSDKPIFNTEYKNNCDWLAWIKIRDLPGDYIYCSVKLVGHRIHSESETTNRINDNTRSMEDSKIIQMLTPKCIANIIHWFYVKSQKSNDM